MKSQNIEQYKKVLPTYESFTSKLKALIEDLLSHEDVKYHLVEGRAKTVQSFSEKISRPNKNYLNPLEEITDLSGIRIIVYYNDDVNKVADLIKKEFDEIEFEDKHQVSSYKVDNFGYLSLHYVIKLKPPRTGLFEWSQFKDLQSEIQIRTVLQHGWATLSHAMQYKHEEDVPKPIRRKLFRLAGLFELADEEILAIKDQAEQSRETASQDIEDGKTNIPISPLSLRAFMESWNKLPEILDFMSDLPYIVESDDSESEGESMNYYGKVSMHCDRIGLNTINELEDSLNFNYQYFITHANEEIGSEWVISNSFLLYLLVIRAHINKFSTDILVEHGWYVKLAEHVNKVAQEDRS